MVKYEAFKIKSYSNINIGYTYLNIDYLKNIIDFGDLVGFGFFGLLYAVERYNPNKDIKFKTYARLRINCAIYDGLREIFPPLPKMIYKDISKIQKAREILKIKLKREAKPEEIAKILGITVEKYYYYIAMSILPYSIISLNEISRYIENKINPEYLLEKKEIKKEVIDALKKLPQREYEVLELYYYEWLTLKEISNIFRISEIRTYKIYRKAMQDLKDIFIKKEIFK